MSVFCRFTTFGLALVALAMTIASAAMADEWPDLQYRIDPYSCEEWQTRVEGLLESDDSIENEIGRLYAKPGMRFCEARQVRVTADFDMDWDFFDLPEWSFLAWVLRAVAIAALLGLCVWLAWRWRNFAPRINRTRRVARSASAAPERADLDDPVDLPNDIPAAAQTAWQENRPRQAMSLLYRGATLALLPDALQSRTEREVIQFLKGSKTNLAVLGYMNRLIDHWLRMAWADQPPSEEDFDLLCQQWSRHCGTTALPPQ